MAHAITVAEVSMSQPYRPPEPIRETREEIQQEITALAAERISVTHRFVVWGRTRCFQDVGVERNDENAFLANLASIQDRIRDAEHRLGRPDLRRIINAPVAL